MSAIDRSFYVLPKDTPVCILDVKNAYAKLSIDRQKYAHHIARAAWMGSLVVPHQVSPEAPEINILLSKLFGAESIDSLRTLAKDKCSFSDDEFEALLVYSGGFIHNNGNYKGFGDTKFVPDLEMVKLEGLIKASASYEKDSKLMDRLWTNVKERMFRLDKTDLNLAMPDSGTTTYHSGNMTKSDTELVAKYMKSAGVEAWNTRLFKTNEAGKTVYEIRMASADTDAPKDVEFEGCVMRVSNGDYAPIMQRMVQELTKANQFSDNEHERTMLSEYIKHFQTGALSAHKDGSRAWIKNRQPLVETYIGFIENYRDPVGGRSEFEGFVACVDFDKSRKFERLVQMAEPFIARLPWGVDYEKDTFLKPDFTSLDILAFGTSGPPAGINIPNYDEIRQDEGFKNVSLSNVISAMPDRPITFLGDQDQALFKKYYKASFEVQVGLHELLGHGSGKLFQKDLEGKFNFDVDKVKDLVTGEKISSWYEPGETWGTVFGYMSSAYEECRAEAVGYYLCCFEDILKVFEYEGEEAQQVKYVNWLSEIRAGLVSLEMYSPEKAAWGQAHSWARHVLLRVVLEAGRDFVSIEETTGKDGKADLMFKLDRKLIDEVGKPAICDFLKLLQAYKSTANVTAATALFAKYGDLDEKWLRIRDVCFHTILVPYYDGGQSPSATSSELSTEYCTRKWLID